MFAKILSDKMILATSISDLNIAISNLPDSSNLGFVPTMGALHSGHISLIKRSVDRCSHTIISIFVNPTQFNNPNDLDRYPRTLQADCALLESSGVDIVFAPSIEDIYPEEDSRVFNFGSLDKTGEGPTRPGHFNGVAQVVTRLFDIVKPKCAFFGEKDFQQLAIIKHFTKGLNYNIEVVPCPIIRDESGLAISSRNELLTKEQRSAAPHIYSSICKAAEFMKNLSPAQTVDAIKLELNSNSFLETEYVEIINGLTLQPISSWNDAEEIQLWCAVYADPIRLIDNIKLK